MENNKGNASQNVMELIIKLETQVRQLKEERDDYRRSMYIALCKPRGIDWAVGYAIGLVTPAIVWGVGQLIRRIWHG